MIEFRFHGRGGQGAVLATEILALAAFREDRHVQSFPFFGVERRGAPVTAFARIDRRPIRIHSDVYEPHHVVVLDESLLGTVDVTAGLREDGWVLVNSERPADTLRVPRGRLAAVDATGIALRHGLGTRAVPVVNTAILGALVRLVPVSSLPTLLGAIRDRVPARPDENATAAEEAHAAVVTVEVVA